MENMGQRKLALALIDDSKRLRPVNPAWAEALAKLMAADGQQTAIKVRWAEGDAPRQLIAGGHRVAAARLNGWTEIDAEEIRCTEDEARLLEIDENLARSGLTQLEEGVFLSERKRVYEALHPETKHGGDRVSEQVANFATRSARFTAATSAELKKSERTIRDRIRIAEALAEPRPD